MRAPALLCHLFGTSLLCCGKKDVPLETPQKAKTLDAACCCRIQRRTDAKNSASNPLRWDPAIASLCSLMGEGGHSHYTVKMRTTKKPLFTGKT